MRHRQIARWTSVFVLIALFVLASPLMAQAPPQSAPRDVLVKFRTVNAQALGDVVREHDIEAAKWVGGNGVIKFRSRSRDAAAMVRALSARPDVLYAEPDYIVTKLVTPNDTYYSSLWAMPKIGAPAAWGVTTGDAKVVVGVVDTGIDYTHPDLAANVWSAPQATAAQSVAVPTSMGVSRCAMSPRPSWPAAFAPQAQRLPSVLRARV